MSYVGWHDPDKKKPAYKKLAEAVANFERKRGVPATSCLTDAVTAAELTGEQIVTVKASGQLARHIFYVDGEDGEDWG